MSDTQQERTVPIGLYVPQRMAEQLKQAAREQDRSMSAVIRLAVEAQLEREARGGDDVSGWIVELGFEAQKDLSTFPWDRTNEVGGVVTGRFECSGFSRRDTGRHLFVRRILASDHGGTPEAVSIDYDSVAGLQTFPVRKWGGRRGGRTGADDYGVWVGMLHSHPGIDRQRELSDTDIRTRQRTR